MFLKSLIIHENLENYFYFIDIYGNIYHIDQINRKILNELQQDGTLSVSEIADRVGLSTSPCWRRIQNLEESGVITKRVALLNPDKLNVGVTVFVRIKTNQHSYEWLEDFAKEIEKIDEVVEFYRMSGDIDYLLRIVVPDIEGFDAVYKRLISVADLADVSSNFAMEKIKYTTALPLNYAN